jgi:hypothetical protein
VLTTQPTLTTTATSSSPPGTYPINISGGTAANYTITDVPGVLTVVASYATTTTVATSSQLSVVGQPVTFTATVTATSSFAGMPVGTVAFIADNALLGFAAVNSATGQATLTTSALGFGSHSIIAEFLGTAPYLNSLSSTLTQYVTAAGTAPTLTLVPVRNRSGKVTNIDITVTVQPTSPGTGTPPGSVTYFLNGRAKYLTEPLTGGTVALAMSPAHLVNKFVYARYNGSRSYLASATQSLYISYRKIVQLEAGTTSGTLRPSARHERAVHHHAKTR